MTIASLLLAVAVSAQSEFASFRKTWGLQAADAARPGLWKAKGKPSDAALLVRVDTGKTGEILHWEWSAELGAREIDIPEDRFWSILDGLSLGEEWVETDPDALQAKALRAPAKELAQGFRCPNCRPGIVAATWKPQGGTRLLVARSQAPARAPRVQLSESVTEEGIQSLARQKGLEIDSRNPCKDGNGSCSMELVGAKGERWALSRAGSAQPWKLLEASFPGPPWWNPEWDWDSLRIQSPREFRLILKNWLDAEIDVDGARLLRPIEPILATSVAEWNSRAVPGLDPGPAVERLVSLPSAPSALVVCTTPQFRLSVDMFGRRKLELLQEKK